MKALAAVTRNKLVESVHWGVICVVDPQGNIVYKQGDPRTKIFYRSSAKPLQVLPFVHSGGAEAMGFTPKEIALACASHVGSPEHQKTVMDILKRLDLKVADLHCGVMSPYHEEENRRLIAANEEPSPLHVSCSGKHAAMLAYCKYRGWDIATYEKIDHPLQQEILKIIALFTEEKADAILVGTDGCGLPICMLPVEKIALSYARLTQCVHDEQSEYHRASKTIFEAMYRHPDMVEGRGEFDTELMETAGGRLIAKVGAEAVYCMGIRQGNLGVCLKIADGNERAVYPVVMQLLLELGIFGDRELETMRKWYRTELTNNLKEHIGDIVPVFHRREAVGLGDSL